MGFTLAYLLTLLLGQDSWAEKLRSCFEVPRRHARHGTRRILSVLSMALYLLSDPARGARARDRLAKILLQLTLGRGVTLPPVFPP